MIDQLPLKKAALHDSFFMNSGEAFFVMDQEGILLESNKAFTKLTGIGAGKATGGPFLSELFALEEDSIRFKSFFRENINMSEFEAECKNSNGDCFSVRIKTWPVAGGQNPDFAGIITPLINIGIFNNKFVLPVTVTESFDLKHIRKSITDLDKALGIVSEMMEGYVYYLSDNGDGGLDFEWVNPMVKLMTSYSEEEIKKTAADTFHTNYSSIGKVTGNQPGPGEQVKPVKTDVMILLKDGQARWIREYNVPVADPKGHAYAGMFGFGMDVTGFKDTESALSESENRFNEIADLLPVIIFEVNLDLDFVYTNRRSLELTGYSQDDIDRGMNLIDIVHKPEIEKIKSNIVELYSKGYSFGNEYTIHKKNGELLHVLAYAKTVVNNGIICGFRGSLIDISIVKKTQKDLDLAYRELKQVFNAGLPMCVVDSSHRILKINDPFLNFLSLKREDVIGKLCYELLHKDTCHTGRCSLRNIMSGCENYESVSVVDLPGKGKKTFIVNTKPYYTDNDSEPFGIVETFLDITESEKAKLELVEREKLLDAILSASPVGIGYVENSRLKWVNHAYSQILGYSLEESRNMMSIFIEKNYKVDIWAIYQELLTNLISHGHAQKEVRFPHKDGHELDLAIQAKLIGGLTDKNKFIFALMDMTEIKEAQKLKEDSMLTLIEAEKKKFEAMQLIERSTHLASIGVVAGGITHEINQPLSAIRVGADSILLWDKHNDNVLPSVIIKVIERVVQAADRISDIIKHMRSLWLNAQNDAIETIEINPTIERAINFISNRISKHKISLRLDLDGEGLMIQANSVQIEMIVNNLISNAIQSLEQTDIKDRTITVSTRGDQANVYLSIQDNGIGLPEVPIEKLFDPFYSTRKSSGGTGLGLAIVDMFLKRFGADIDARNLDSGGAAFTITFKRKITG